MDDKHFGENAFSALLYTNAKRTVVYANWHFLQMMGYDRARPIIGEPLAKVLGIDQSRCDTWFDGHQFGVDLPPLPLEISHGGGLAQAILCKGRPVYDANDEFVGLNMAFALATPAPTEAVADKRTTDNPARDYTLSQVEAIRVFLSRIIGMGVVERLDEAVNAAARRGGWPVEFWRGPVMIDIALNDTAILREILSITVRQAADVAGQVWITREMQAAEAGMPAELVAWAEQNGFRGLSQ